MSSERRVIPLRGDTPGAVTEFISFLIGPEDAPEKVYLQAALHADEHPGTMLLIHLIPMLMAADAAGRLNARFVVVPLANPLGMANIIDRKHVGRYDIRTGVNYNRRWPDLFAAVRSQVVGRLTDDERFNVTLIRRAVANWIDAQSPRSAAEELRLLLLRECHDAEFVFDLHCDADSLLHIYTSPELMPELQDLSDWMGAAAVMVAADSGGGSFDEVLPNLYRKVANTNPGKPVPLATATATLEYRGQADVFDEIGAEDARRLYGFLCGRGLISDDPGPLPGHGAAGTPFDATEIVRAESSGLVAYRVGLGEMVKKGQPVADLIALDGPDAFIGRTPVLAGTDGLVLTRATEKYVQRGAPFMKIVGKVPLAGRKGGYLLED